ncbi:hypothetical protein LTR78_003618 [Recurvomyces mirabilis]|uniref:Subtelomeric hrmA-associated cluster protein AFUB-079030/YDR124W-like helical bundle domain-containing protein n=1 Tax=Recurvomyces mirabilis TaxID=574656 RepID=A0AAE0WQV7_9PEZI|nr:hypothetical protein LTR78_003618 [Recurvomyces mirabilis]KAK5154732.1 hypothetical protein LTS14_006311 [Recurvomyces mirabilis]
MARFGSSNAREGQATCEPGPPARIKIERGTETALTKHDGTQTLAAFVITHDGHVRLHKSNEMKSGTAIKLLSTVFMHACGSNHERAEARPSLICPATAESSDHTISGRDNLLDVDNAVRRSTSEGEQSSGWRGRSIRRPMRDRTPLIDFYDGYFPDHEMGVNPSIKEEAQSMNNTTIPADSAAQHFNITEPEKVKAYLYNRFEKLQQLSAKRVAKAWIKGICPRKQANFPYQNKQKTDESGGPDIPAWWPDQSICPWKEPDHIRKEERNELLIHILRLRPTPAKLLIMNRDKCEPLENQVFESWAAFLRSLAPLTCCNDLKPNDKSTKTKRNNLLREIYDVAEKEENFLEGSGPPSVIYWQDEQLTKTVSRKSKKRAISIASSSGTEDQISAPRQSSVNRGRRAMKRRRCRSVVQSPELVPRLQVRQSSLNPVKEQNISDIDLSSPEVDTAMLNDRAAAPTKPVAAEDAKSCVFEHLAPLSVPRTEVTHAASGSWQPAHHDSAMQNWQTMIASPDTSFNSSTFAAESPTSFRAFDNGTLQQQYTDRHEHRYARHQNQYFSHPHAVHIYQAQHIPQPQFEIVPNTPKSPRSGLLWPNYDLPAVAQCLDTPMTDTSFAYAQIPSAPTPAPAHFFHSTDHRRQSRAPTTHYTPVQQQYQLVAPADLHQQTNNMHGLPDPAFVYAGHSAAVPDSPYPHVLDHHHAAPQWLAESHLERGFTGHSSGVGGGQPT